MLNGQRTLCIFIINGDIINFDFNLSFARMTRPNEHIVALWHCGRVLTGLVHSPPTLTVLAYPPPSLVLAAE